MFGEDGQPLFLDGVVFDVTERKRFEADLAAKSAELAKSESRFRSLVTNIPGVVYRCLIDADWTDIYVSDYSETLTGYPASDFFDRRVRSYASITHPDDAEMIARTVALALVGPQVRETVRHLGNELDAGLLGAWRQHPPARSVRPPPSTGRGCR